MVSPRWLQRCVGPRTAFLAASADGAVVALSKACGVLSHPNPGPSKAPALINGLYDYANEVFSTTVDGEVLTTHLLHRLDQNTSGVMLVATDKLIAQKIKELFKKRLVQKEYIAAVFGIVPKRTGEGMWKDSYQSNVGRREQVVRARSPDGLGDKTACTEVSIQRHVPRLGITLIKLKPVTGYAHQLRLQCALRGYPIVGDDVYGDFARNKAFASTFRIESSKICPGSDLPSAKDARRLFLHARSLVCKDSASAALLPVPCLAPLPRPFQLIQDIAAATA